MVERRLDPADRRARRVELTEEGSAALASARQRLRGVEDALLAPLEPEQRESLRRLLHQLATGGDLGGGAGSSTEAEQAPSTGSRRTRPCDAAGRPSEDERSAPGSTPPTDVRAPGAQPG